MITKAYANMAARINSLRSAAENEEGATAVEYGLIVAAIAVAVGAGIALLAPAIGTLLSGTVAKL